MAKSTTSNGGKSTAGKSSGNPTIDKIAKAAMSREMLAAGLTAAAPRSPQARPRGVKFGMPVSTPPTARKMLHMQ